MRDALALFSVLCLLTCGCALTSTAPSSIGEATQGPALQGFVFGGQQPLNGSHVYVFAANTTGYGGPGIAPSASNASLSLLDATKTLTSDSIGAYVLTIGPNGSFSIPAGYYTCTPGSQVYVYSTGGDPGTGNNSAASLMAIAGTCPAAGNFNGTTPKIVLNEVSTIAAAYSFAGFASDPIHVSSSNTSLALTGIANAFATAGTLETLTTGAVPTYYSNGALNISSYNINTLGNILAACVNSNGAGSAGCTTLFNNIQSNGSNPADTATAAIYLAHSPGSNISALFALQTPTSPFQPSLSAAPNDFTIVLIYNSNQEPDSIALDGSGNVWVANAQGYLINNSVTSPPFIGEIAGSGSGYISASYDTYKGPCDSSCGSIAIDPSGNPWVANLTTNTDGTNTICKLVPPGPTTHCYSGAGYVVNNNVVGDLAIDGSGDIWLTDGGDKGVSEFSNTGVPISTTPYTATNLTAPTTLAIDATGAVWVVNPSNNSVAKFDHNGNLLSGSAGYLGGGLSTPNSIAFDAAGNAWVSNTGNNTLSVLSSSGSLLRTASGGGLAGPGALAIDGAGNVWAFNLGSGSQHVPIALLSAFSNAGVSLSPSGYGKSFNSYYVSNSIAVDASGNVWVALELAYDIGTRSNYAAYYVYKIVGAATPVVTPLSVGIKTNSLGTRP